MDCVLLIRGNRVLEPVITDELQKGLPFLSIEVAREVAFAGLVDEFFATDREMVPKGVVEVIL